MSSRETRVENTQQINPAVGTSNKTIYIEYIRAWATIAVVFLHIVMTLNANYTIAELGIGNYIIFNNCYMLVKWAVPCFIMISGALLLNPYRIISVVKIKKYLIRMLLVLMSFGLAYALMEIIFTEKRISLSIILQALLNVAEANSWSHMWYIYVLIALYILTIPIKCIIDHQPMKKIYLFLIILIIGNFVIPTCNAIFHISLDNYMMLNEYATYYLLGYCVSTIKDEKLHWAVIIPGIISTILMIVTDTISLLYNSKELAMNHTSGEALVLIQAVSVFLFIRYCCVSSVHKIGILCKIICSCSFGIYLVHPLFINIIYKVMKITPLIMPIFFGIITLFALILVLSTFSAWILKKVPLIKEIL